MRSDISNTLDMLRSAEQQLGVAESMTNQLDTQAQQRLSRQASELLRRLEQHTAGVDEIARALDVSWSRNSTVEELIDRARRLSGAPAAQSANFASDAWELSIPELRQLLAAGMQHRDLTRKLAGKIVPNALRGESLAVRNALSMLPLEFDENGFQVAVVLADLLAELISEADSLGRRLGAESASNDLRAVESVIHTAHRATCPGGPGSRGTGASTGTPQPENAVDLAAAIELWREILREIGCRVTDAAWRIDLEELQKAREAIAGWRKNPLRRFDRDWKASRRTVETTLVDSGGPLEDVLDTLDGVIEGRLALQQIALVDFQVRTAHFKNSVTTNAASERHPAPPPFDTQVAPQSLVKSITTRQDQTEIKQQIEGLRALLNRAAPLCLFLWTELGGAADPSAEDIVLSVDRVPLRSLQELCAFIADTGRQCATILAAPFPNVAERTAILNLLPALQDAERTIQQFDTLGRQAFGRAWRGVASDWDALSESTRWVVANVDIRHLVATIEDPMDLLRRLYDSIRQAEDLVNEANALFMDLHLAESIVFDVVKPAQGGAR